MQVDASVPCTVLGRAYSSLGMVGLLDELHDMQLRSAPQVARVAWLTRWALDPSHLTGTLYATHALGTSQLGTRHKVDSRAAAMLEEIVAHPLTGAFYQGPAHAFVWHLVVQKHSTGVALTDMWPFVMNDLCSFKGVHRSRPTPSLTAHTLATHCLHGLGHGLLLAGHVATLPPGHRVTTHYYQLPPTYC